MSKSTLNTIKIINGRTGYKNSKLGIDVAIAQSLKGKRVVFVFNNYLSQSFTRFNNLLKKAGISNYQTKNIDIRFDKLLLMKREEVDRWIKDNVQHKADLIIIDTLNTSTGRYKKTKHLESSLDNLNYLSSTLDCSVIGLYTGVIPWLLKTNIGLLK